MKRVEKTKTFTGENFSQDDARRENRSAYMLRKNDDRTLRKRKENEMKLIGLTKREPIWKYSYAATYRFSWDMCLAVIGTAFRNLEEPKVSVSESAKPDMKFEEVEVEDEKDLLTIPEAGAIQVVGYSRIYGGNPFWFCVYDDMNVIDLLTTSDYVGKLLGKDGDDEERQRRVFDKFVDSLELKAYGERIETMTASCVIEEFVEKLTDEECSTYESSYGSGTKAVDLSKIRRKIATNYFKTKNAEKRMREFEKTLPTSPAFRIRFADEKPDLTNSKVGGDFPWPNDSPPKLSFLCQINFSELPENDLFPKKGLLQFFVDGDDDLYGACDSGNGHEVVFHEEITKDFRRFSGPDVDELYGEYLGPVVGEAKMTFEQGEERMTWGDYRFEKLRKKFPGIPDKIVYDREELYGDGSKLLGYPCFVQVDPRDEDDPYDVLLLQLDSNDSPTEWGDAGIANFFVNSEALKRRVFSDVLYNWDCG